MILAQHQSLEQRPAMVFQYLNAHSRLKEEIKAQELDLLILRQEKERLKMKTIPKLNDNYQKQVVMKTNMWTHQTNMALKEEKK